MALFSLRDWVIDDVAVQVIIAAGGSGNAACGLLDPAGSGTNASLIRASPPVQARSIAEALRPPAPQQWETRRGWG